MRGDQGADTSRPTSSSAAVSRAALNYGHTLAHALEIATGHALRHGEAVAIGLVFAAPARRLRSSGSTSMPSRAHEELVAVARRSRSQAPGGLRADDLLPIMARDKKSGGGLTFVLAGPSGIERVDDPDPAAVRKALAAVGVEACMATILLLSGPNLNLLGEREPEHYGTTTLDELVALATETAAKLGHELEHVQSNHEGVLIDAIHARARALRGDRLQRRRLLALRVRAHRRARDVRRRRRSRYTSRTRTHASGGGTAR